MSRSAASAPTSRGPVPRWAIWGTTLCVALSGSLALGRDTLAKAPPGPTLAETLSSMRQDVEVHRARVQRLVQQHASPRAESASTVYRLQSRINDGLVFHQLRDFDKAAILLMEVVQDDANQAYPGYKDALFYLAESLYQLDNPIGAGNFYLMVLQRGYQQYRKDSLLRLVEISSRLRQHESLERYVAQLNSMPEALADPQIRYVYAKSLYARERYDAALREFERIPAGSEYFARARYFMGTLQVMAGQLEPAAAYFQQVIQVQGDAPELRESRELAYLALARIRLEGGVFDQAIDAYQHIPRDSKHFEQALFEVSWAFIKAGQFDSALRSLDILLLAAPESPLAPEASLLKGNLQLRLAKHDDAEGSFEDIVSRFGPVRDELDAVMRRHRDPEAYFRQLVGEDGSRHFDVQVALPPLASRWLAEDERVTEALRPVRDLDGATEEIREAEALVARLEEALMADNRIEVFPELNEAWRSIQETENALILTKQRLVGLERDLLGPASSEQERGELTRIEEQRLTLEREYMALPRTSQDAANREARVERSLEDLEMKAFQLGIILDALRAQLVAMQKWIQDTAGRSDRPTAQIGETRVRQSVEEQQAEVLRHEADLRALRLEITRQRGAVGTGDAVQANEGAVARRYDGTLAEQARLMQRLRSRLAPEAQRDLAEADRLRADIASIEEQIRGFYATVQRRVDSEVRSLKAQVEAEKRLVGRYGRQAEGFRGMGETLAGQVAFQSLRDVDGQFRDLVLKAEVGILDVAWAQKEEKSRRYRELVRERKAELQALEQDFRPVLEDKK